MTVFLLLVFFKGNPSHRCIRHENRGSSEVRLAVDNPGDHLEDRLAESLSNGSGKKWRTRNQYRVTERGKNSCWEEIPKGNDQREKDSVQALFFICGL